MRASILALLNRYRYSSRRRTNKHAARVLVVVLLIVPLLSACLPSFITDLVEETDVSGPTRETEITTISTEAPIDTTTRTTTSTESSTTTTTTTTTATTTTTTTTALETSTEPTTDTPAATEPAESTDIQSEVTEPGSSSTSETVQEVGTRVQRSINSLPLPGSTLATQDVPPAAAAPVSPNFDPYWRYDPDPLRLSIMELIAETLDAGLEEVNIASAFQGVIFEDEAAFRDMLDTLIFTVKEGNPRYFYYDNTIHTYYTYYDVEGGRTFSDYLVQMTIKPEYKDPAVREQEWQRVEQEATAVAAAIMERTTSDWQRLRLAHDYLTIKNYYSPEADVSTNNVVSGLLGSETMCVGYAQAFQMIAERMGYPTYNIYGYANNEAHDWNIVRLGDQWYHVDVTFDDPINNDYPTPLVQTSYFLRSTEAMQRSHVIYSYNVPSAPADYTANYRDYGILVSDPSELPEIIGTYMEEADYHDDQPDVLEFYLDGFTLSLTDFDRIMNQSYDYLYTQYPYYYYLISDEVGSIYLTLDP